MQYGDHHYHTIQWNCSRYCIHHSWHRHFLWTAYKTKKCVTTQGKQVEPYTLFHNLFYIFVPGWDSYSGTTCFGLPPCSVCPMTLTTHRQRFTSPIFDCCSNRFQSIVSISWQLLHIFDKSLIKMCEAFFCFFAA